MQSCRNSTRNAFMSLNTTLAELLKFYPSAPGYQGVMMRMIIVRMLVFMLVTFLPFRKHLSET